jgi:hypothetical protein
MLHHFNPPVAHQYTTTKLGVVPHNAAATTRSRERHASYTADSNRESLFTNSSRIDRSPHASNESPLPLGARLDMLTDAALRAISQLRETLDAEGDLVEPHGAPIASRRPRLESEGRGGRAGLELEEADHLPVPIPGCVIGVCGSIRETRSHGLTTTSDFINVG